jgi:hypothetical protein
MCYASNGSYKQPKWEPHGLKFSSSIAIAFNGLMLQVIAEHLAAANRELMALNR